MAEIRPPEVRNPSTFDRGDWAAIVVCALGFTFDLGEIVLGTALSAVFSAGPQAASAAHISWLLTSVYLGAIVGAPALGAVADRRGRCRTLSLSMLLLAVTSVAASISPDIVSLGVSRCLSGIALGAYPPLMIAYLVDLLPARSRGAGVLITVAIGYLGPPATIFLIRGLTAAAPFGWEGWRWVLLADGIGAAAVAILFTRLREPTRWIATSSQPVDAPLRSPGFPLVAALSFLSPWATVAFPLLTGVLLIQKGFNLSDTFLYVGVSVLGPFVGTALAALGADRLERRTSLMLCGAGMAGFSALFWATATPAWLMVSATGFNLLVALYIPALSVYTAEWFPTAIRARQSARAWAINRAAAALGPLLLVPILNSQGASALVIVVVGVMGASVLLVALDARQMPR